MKNAVEGEGWDGDYWSLEREARAIQSGMEGRDSSIVIETGWIRRARVFGDCWEDWIRYGTLCDWSQQYKCSVEWVLGYFSMVDRRLRDEEDDAGVYTLTTRYEGCASCDGVLWRRIACSCAHLQRCEETVLPAGVILCVFSEGTVGAVFIRNACCRLRGGAHVIVPVRASLMKRRVLLDPSALSGCEGKCALTPWVAG